MTAPERIELAEVRVVLRRYVRDDLDALRTAIEESRDHLRPFMPWADGTRADTTDFLTAAIASWDAGTEFNYGIFEDGGALLGGCGLHARLRPGALEIGYWLRAGATGRGIATAAARALTDAALALPGIEAVEIHCDEANVRSAAVPRRLGYRLDRIEADQISAPGDVGRSMIWVKRRSSATAAASRVRRSAHDANASNT
jgi:RimJ/RimL family protein N-acetyltransferase